MRVAEIDITVPGWSGYLMELEQCEGLAAYDGPPLEPFPAESINCGKWEWSGGGINFHLVLRADRDGGFPAPPPPASLFARWAFIAVVSTITGAWLAFLWRMFA